MAIIKKYSPKLGLKNQDVFIEDKNPDSPYFNITEFPKTFTGGKNAFLFEGSPFLKKGSNVRFEILDVEGNTIYVEPGQKYGKTFRDGTSIVVAVHIYDDTPIGIGSISIVGELETCLDDKGRVKKVPNKYRGRPNIRWTQNFKVNPKIPNSTQIRFFKRPTFSVTEIEKSLLIKTNMTLNKSGSVIGIPNTPDTGSDFSNWTAPSQYLIKLQQGNKFTQSMDENTTLVVDSIGYSSSVLEVLNEDEMLVRRPYLVNDIVNEFNAASYSMEFESVEDATIATSSINASYAEIRLENLATFTGDVARIKIFRKSRNDLGDFQVVQENKLDATELLRDFTLADRTVINYGKLRKENVTPYYTTSSGVQIHNEHLINSLLVSGSHSVESSGSIGEFEIVSGSEYQFSYSARYSGSGASVGGDSLRFLIVTSSNNTTNCTVTTQSLDLVSGSYDRNSDGLGNIEKTTKNFFSNVTGKAQIRAKANTTNGGGQFYFNKLSLKNAEESSYSPDEYTAIVDIPRKNPTEQFDFRVEFYDINNNFIPIKVEQSVPFTKGNQSRILETAVLVSASGVADAGDILNVDDSGVVQISSTNIQSSTIAGIGNPVAFNTNLKATTGSLTSQTTQLSVATASLSGDVINAVLSGSVSSSNAATSASLSGSEALTQATNAALTGSTSASIALTGNQDAVLSGSLSASIAETKADNAALSASASGSVEPSTGLITKAPAPSNNGLYLGSTNLGFYSASKWNSYMDNAGQFFLTGSSSSNYLRWDGQTLKIGGAIVLTNGTPDVDLTPLNNFTASEVPTISGSSGRLNKAITPSASDGPGLFLGSTNLGFFSASAWQTYMSSSGDFELNGTDGFLRWNAGSSSLLVHGRVSGSSIEGGTIAGSTLNIPDANNPKFSVDEGGNMTAQDATISGSISVDDGIVGLWHVIESGSGGALQSAELAASSSLILDPATPEMLFKSGSTSLDTKLRLKPASEWQSTGGSNLSISGMDYTLANLNSSGSLPTSSGSTSNTVYGAYVHETNTTSTYTVEQTGTFEVQVRQPHTITVDEPAAISGGTTSYPNYSPSFAGQQHPWSNNSSPITFYLYSYFVADGITGESAGTQQRVLIKTVYHTGDYTSSPYYESVDAGEGLEWTYNSGTTTNNANTNYSGNAAVVSTSLYLKEGTYKFRYEHRAGVRSGYNRNTDSAGNQTFNYTTDQFAYSALTGASTMANATIVVPTNVVELTAKGLQLLTDSNTYVQVSRLDTGFGAQPTLVKVEGGKVAISGDDNTTTADLTSKHAQHDTGSFNRIDSFGYTNGTSTHGGIKTDVRPHRTDTYDIGSSVALWDDVYATNGTINTSDRNQKENISGSNLGLTFVNNLEPVKFNFKGKTRTHYGLIAQQVSESLASSSIHTDNFAGYIESNLYRSGGMDFDKKYIEQQGWDINDFTVVDTTYGLRYTEMIAPMVKAIQELTTRIEELESE